QHERLPKTLHVSQASTHVDWSAGAVELLTEARDWRRSEDRTRRAGVSSFGISGTNAHVIIEEPPAEDAAADTTAKPSSTASVTLPVVPWLVSAKTPTALAAQAGRLAPAVADLRGVDVAHTLATARAGLEHRAVVLGADDAELRAGLAALADGSAAVRGVAREGLTGFVFSGQGGQRVGMGRELAETFPVFDAALDEVCAHFDPVLDRPLRAVMFTDPDGELDNTGWAQPALV